METEMISFELPAELYAKLASLAADGQTEPVEVIGRLIERAYQRRAWHQDLAALREQIQQDGGLQVGSTKDEVVERLRRTRRAIFEAEYAHLYR
jgi:predicted transcriptional regulator